MLTDPAVHGDARGYAGVDRPCRAVLADAHDRLASSLHVVAQPGTFLAKHQHTSLRERGGFDRHGARYEIDTDQRQRFCSRPPAETINRPVVHDVLVAVGHHCATPVPLPLAHDMHRSGEKGIGVAHDGTDVEVVLPVLDRHLEGMPALVEVGHDGLTAPVAITIDNVAPVAVAQQIRVEAGIVGPRLRMRPEAHLTIAHEAQDTPGVSGRVPSPDASTSLPPERGRLGEVLVTNESPWWHGAVGYEIYIRSFADANNDGIGDLEGIRRRLPHLVDLGVDALWITPFYPSPGHDHGYDVADYTDVDPQHGTLDDFDRMTADAHHLGLKVIVDLVPNHTSSHHPWFQSALQGRQAPHRDFYIWRDPAPDGGPPNNWVSHFGGPAWTLDAASGQYFCHLFLPEQPDLNWSNHEVVAAFDDILRFWCERGVDGFRIDVAHSLVKDPWFRSNPQLAPVDLTMDPQDVFGSFEHRYDLDQNTNVKIFRRWNEVVRPYGAMLLGEVGPDDPVRHARYYDGGAALHRNFYLTIAWMEWLPMQLRDRIRGIHLAAPDSTAWILDSHDTSHAPTRYGGGERGAHRALCVKTLMLALGGMPVIYQGEELGLEDGDIAPQDLADPISTRNPGATSGRDGARTVMPWDEGPTNGFNDGAAPWLPAALRLREETVAGQRADPDSFLERYRRLLRLRRSRPELWTAPVSWLETDESVLLALRRGDTVVAANLDEHDAELHLPAGVWKVLFSTRNGTPPTQREGSIVVPAESSLILGLVSSAAANQRAV